MILLCDIMYIPTGMYTNVRKYNHKHIKLGICNLQYMNICAYIHAYILVQVVHSFKKILQKILYTYRN